MGSLAPVWFDTRILNVCFAWLACARALCSRGTDRVGNTWSLSLGGFWYAARHPDYHGLVPLTLQRVLMGKPLLEWAKLPQLKSRELAVLIPLMILIVLLGIVPGPLVSIITTALSVGPLSLPGLLVGGR